MNELIQKAVDVASNAHKNQFRKEFPLPFIIHPLKVLEKMARWGIKDEEMWVAAILHDTVEDTALTIEDIEQEFGYNVSNIVDYLTFEKTKQTKQEYLDGIAKGRLDVLVIKVADRLSNVEDFFVTNPVYTKKYFEKAEVLFTAVWWRRPEFDREIWNKLSEGIIEVERKLNPSNGV
jgi:GTP diphosphokinase / guanosine-3',5'-bis(diphosphate) 3'-diphosphatase